jgi:hypothetical protein
MICPLCKLPAAAVGRLVAGNDSAGLHFVFSLCRTCAARLERLPVAVQRRQLAIAISRFALDLERYRDGVFFFNSETEARIFCRLEAERLSARGAGCDTAASAFH